MPFCQKCGQQYQGEAAFCASCGHKLNSTSPSPRGAVQAQPGFPRPYEGEQLLWQGRPHAKNLTKSQATLYEITTERIKLTRGLLSKKVEEVELTRVKDITVEQSLGQRALRIGNVKVITTDRSAPEVILWDVTEPQQVKETLRRAVREEKQRQGVAFREDV